MSTNTKVTLVDDTDSKVTLVQPVRLLVHVEEYLEVVENITYAEIEHLLGPAFTHLIEAGMQDVDEFVLM